VHFLLVQNGHSKKSSAHEVGFFALQGHMEAARSWFLHVRSFLPAAIPSTPTVKRVCCNTPGGETVAVNRIEDGAFLELQAQVEALAKRRDSKLRSFLRRFERDPQLVDDLVQDVYVEVLRSLKNYGGRSCLETWIFGVAVNVGRQHVAKAVAHRQRFVDPDTVPPDARGAPDVLHIVSMQQRLQRVESRVSTMPESLSSTFEAYIKDGLTYEEAAKSLSIPIGTVRSRIFRVRELVQDC
jgi:RNA polymerase sigma factor (sigma-70 family)